MVAARIGEVGAGRTWLTIDASNDMSSITLAARWHHLDRLIPVTMIGGEGENNQLAGSFKPVHDLDAQGTARPIGWISWKTASRNLLLTDLSIAIENSAEETLPHILILNAGSNRTLMTQLADLKVEQTAAGRRRLVAPKHDDVAVAAALSLYELRFVLEGLQRLLSRRRGHRRSAPPASAWT